MAAHDNLGGQFRKREGEGGSTRFSTYSYVKTAPETVSRYNGDTYEAPIDRSHLSMTVEHRSGVSAFVMRQPADWVEDDDIMHQSGSSYTSSHYRAADKDLDNEGPNGQMKLFGMYSTPPTSKIGSMYGTKEGSRHAMTMLGIAHNDNMREYGRSLVPDESLSPHSHKLAKNLSERTGNAKIAPSHANPTNDIDFDAEGDLYWPGESKQVPEGEVRAARSLVRGVIKGQRSLDMPKRGKEFPPPTDEPQTGPVNPAQFKLF